MRHPPPPYPQKLTLKFAGRCRSLCRYISLANQIPRSFSCIFPMHCTFEDIPVYFQCSAILDIFLYIIFQCTFGYIPVYCLCNALLNTFWDISYAVQFCIPSCALLDTSLDISYAVHFSIHSLYISYVCTFGYIPVHFLCSALLDMFLYISYAVLLITFLYISYAVQFWIQSCILPVQRNFGWFLYISYVVRF
jgi:hypothetical protein